MAANASGIKAGRAYVSVGTDESDLEKGLRSAEQRVKAFGQAITAIGAGLAGVGTAITTPFLAAAKSFADAGSALNDMSARTGVSVEALSALGHAATQTGTDLETVEGGIRKMQRALVAGSEENMAAAGTFASLGLSVERLSRLKPEQQFEAIAKTIGAIHDPTAKAGAAMQVFGKSGTALLPMIDDLAALTKEAKDFGLVWTGEEAKKADALGDSLDLLKASLGRVVSVIGSALAPLLTEVATDLASASKYAIDFAKANGPLIVQAFKIGVAVTAAGAGIVGLGIAISGVGAVLGAMATGIGAVGAVMTALVSPIGLVVAGLAGLATWFFTSTAAGVQALGALGGAFNSLKETATTAFKGIADALRAGDIGLAGQILWAGLKVEWLKGVNFLKGLWADWGTATTEVFRGVSFKIAGLMVDAWAAVQSSFAKMTTFIKNLWSESLGWIVKQSNDVAAALETALVHIKNPLGGAGLDAELKRIEEARQTANKFQDVATAEASASSAPDLNKIEANRQAAQQALGDQQGAETDARRKAAQEGLAADAAALKAAQDELSGLVGKAGKEAAAAAVVPKLKKAGVPEFDPAALGGAVEAAKAKIDVTGTFSAAATRGLGVGSTIQDDTLKETKGIRDEMVKLNHRADLGRLVFS